MLLFKVNYDYKLKILLLPKQIKKQKNSYKKKVKIFINLYKNFKELVKLVQEYIKRYYNLKVFKEPNLKKGGKVQLLYKNLIILN